MSSAVSFRDDMLGGIQTGDGSEKKSKLGKGKSKKSANKKSLLVVHFETVIILLRLKTNSYEKALFLFIVLTFLISVTNMNNFLLIVKEQYPDISQSTSAFSLMNSLKYLDVAQLLGFAGSSSLLVTIGVSIYMIGMTLLYCICFFDKWQNPKSKPRKYFYGRWFVNMQNYFMQLLFFPFNVIFLSFIVCSKENLEGAAEQCSFSGDENSYYSIIFAFSLTGFILSVLNEWWMQVFFYNTKLYKKDATSIEKEPSFMLEVSACRLIIAIFTTVRSTDSYTYFVFFMLFQTLAFIYLYIRHTFTLASFTLANNNLHTAYQYGIIFLLAQQLSFIVDEACRATDFYESKSEKFLFYLFFFCVTLVAVTIKAKEIQMRYIIFRPIELAKLSPTQLFHKIAIFQKLNSASSTSVFHDSIYKGLANEHIENPCFHPNQVEVCFCKQKILYDPKKRKDTPLDKIFYSQNNSVFTKFMVKSWYETYLFLHQSQYINYLYYSEFLYFKMKNVSLSLKNLAILENKYLTPVQTFRLFRLKHFIIKHNRKRNHDSYRVNQSDKDNRNKLEIETVIPTEEQISQIQSGIKFIIKNNIRFWAYLDKSNINLNEINKLAKFSLKQLDLLKKLWKECMYYVDYRKKWRFYYCWYYVYILNRKIKASMLDRFAGISSVNENDVFSEELQQDNMDDDVLSVHSNLKPDEMEKIYVKKVEMAFDKKSVIFHVNHEYKGKILKVNRAIYHGFGYTSLELVGNVYISQLMPRIYQNIHPTLMKNFAQTGKTKTLYSQRKIFCLNKSGHLFAAWKFVKQYVTTTGKCEYVAMIRPITPPAGTKIYYIICNEDWDIDSMSETLYDGFGMSALQYQNTGLKLLLNILIFAPKLIRYTKFAKYLTEQDFKLFQNREQQEKRKTNNLQQIKNFTSRFSLLAKIRREQQNQYLMQDSNGFNSPRDTSMAESDSTPQSNNHYQAAVFNPAPKPLSAFSQLYSQQVNQPSQQAQTNGQSTTPTQKPNISVTPNITPNVLAPNSIGPRKLVKKRTLVINSEDNNNVNGNGNANNNNDLLTNSKLMNPLGVDEGDGVSPKQLQKDVTKDSLSVDNPQRERRNSNLEILEQLNYGQNQQFLQTNFIRDEILKKKQLFLQQKNQSSSFNEENDVVNDLDKSDYEIESDENLNGIDEETNDFLKLDNLERGDSVNFRMKIPTNLNDLMSEYHQRISQVIQRKASRVDQSTTYNLKTTKFFQTTVKNNNNNNNNSNLGDLQTNYATESHDKSVYHIIKDMILKYQLKKSYKEYNGSCSASYKKTGKQRIIVMKFSRFDECIKKNRGLKHMNKQISGSGDQDPGKKLHSILSGAMGDFVRQVSQTDNQQQKMNNFISMRSEFSDAQQSVTSNTFMNNKFQGKPGEQVHTDTEEYGGANQNVKEEDIMLGKTNGMGYQLKMISEQDENGIMSERTLKTFHKDFINRQGAKNINLSQNIYIKEDNHKSNKNIQTIQNLKIFVRLFFLTLIALNAFTFFYGPNQQFPLLRKQSNKIFQAENVLLSALQAYNLILDQIMVNQDLYDAPLQNNKFWNENTYQSLIQQQLQNETDYFYATNSDTDYKQTFYDQSVTPYKQFDKPLFVGDNVPTDLKSELYILDTYDLFSEVIFSLQTIQETEPKDITLELTPVAFFRENIFPNLFDALKKAQNNLVYDLKDTTDQVYFFLIIIIIVESVLLFASFVILFYLIFVICNAFKSVIEVFPKISQRDLTKIKNYNMELNQNFSYIVEKDDLLSGTHQIYQSYMINKSGATGNGRIGSEHDGTENGQIARKHTHNFDLEEPNDGNENVGKKSKNVSDGGFLSKLKVNIFVFFAIFITFVAIFSTIFLFLILQSTTNLQRILDNGDVFMSSFGDNIVMMVAIKEKKLDIDNYNTIFKAKIQEQINQYNSRNMQPTVESLDFLTFDDVFNTIFYSDPCSELTTQLKEESANSEECKIVAQGSLGHGVASFNSFYKNAISNYIANSVDSDKLDNSIVFDYDRGIYFVDIFQVYLIKVWSDNTDTYLQSQLTLIIIFVSVMFISLLIVYIIVTEKLLIGRFNNEYAYFRTIYSMYMPDIIIMKEKRIKYYLVKHKILNK